MSLKAHNTRSVRVVLDQSLFFFNYFPSRVQVCYL
jgi:hypothetical protein